MIIQIVVLIVIAIIILLIYFKNDDSEKIEIIKKSDGKNINFVMTSYKHGLIKGIQIFKSDALAFYFKSLKDDIIATKNKTARDFVSGKRIYEKKK